MKVKKTSQPDLEIKENTQTVSQDHAKEEFAEILRKAIATYLIAKKGKTPEEAAFDGDQKGFQTGEEIKIGKGEDSVEDAMENFIDRKTAQFCTWFEANGPALCEKGGEIAGALIGTLLAPWCPQAIVAGRKIGQTVAKALAPTLVPLIQKGSQKLRDFAKKIYGKITEKVKQAEGVITNISKLLIWN